MKLTGKLVLVFLMCFASTSLAQLKPFPNNSNISDNIGFAKTDSTFYWPVEIFIDSLHFHSYSLFDTTTVRHYSDFLVALDEPILSNTFLGKEVIRLTWLRSFHPKIVIRIEKVNDKVIIYQKKIKDPKPIEIEKDTYQIPRYTAVKLRQSDSKSKLTLSQYTSLIKVIEKSGYFKMSTTSSKHSGTDGSNWIIEFHNENGWFVVDRWSPDENDYHQFRELGDYIIDLSKFKREERY